MIRFFFRALALVALAVAVIFAVVDTARTVAASELVVTPLRESWQAGMPKLLESARSSAEDLHPLVWDPVITTILELPGFLVFAALSLLLYAIGHRPARRYRRIAVES